MKRKNKHKKISIPKYTLGEEIFNSISHGIGAGLAIAAIVLMAVKAKKPIEEVSVCLFGSTMIILYTISCIYHALSPKITGKKVLRVIDHCNVYLLVWGTYIPICLVAISGFLGWTIFGILTSITVLGITLSAINIEKFKVMEVICHLMNGWGSLLFINILINSMTKAGVMYLIIGGICYTVGSVLYGLGANKKYMHSVFHIFCLLGTFFHFITIYFFVI